MSSGVPGVVAGDWQWLDSGGSSGAPPLARAAVSRAHGGAVGLLLLARPSKLNAWNHDLFRDWDAAVAALAAREGVRAAVLCAEGPAFTAGLDLSLLADIFGRYQGGAASSGTGSAAGGAISSTSSGGGSSSGGAADDDGAACPARQRRRFGESIRAMQASYSALEAMPFPVIAAVHGPCVGAGVDLTTACDMRYATADAYFCVKEVDVGITADLGTLQRLPPIVGHGVAVDMALTARRVGGREAAVLGLVARCFEERGAMMDAALKAAADIAAKPPLAVWGTKRILLHSRDAPGGVPGGLDHVALHNAAFLLSEDIGRLLAARGAGRPPRYSKL